MSTAASYEVEWTNKHLAEQIDWRLTEVAYHMTQAAFKGADGEAVLLHQLPNIGKLTCTNTGAYTVEVTVVIDGYDGKLGVAKEFGLGNGHMRNPNNPIQLRDGGPTSPADMDGCPDRHALADGLMYLHETYTHQQAVGSSGVALVAELDNYRDS